MKPFEHCGIADVWRRNSGGHLSIVARTALSVVYGSTTVEFRARRGHN